MDREEFEAILEKLTFKQRTILRHFLSGKTDKEIADLMDINPNSVSQQISRIASRFGFFNETGERNSYREELRDLFIKYSPEWVADKFLKIKPPMPGRPFIPGEKSMHFYIQSTFEKDCNREILEPGALVRIKAPSKMGKTSLLYRILAKASDSGYHTITYNLRQKIDQIDSRQFFTQLYTLISQEPFVQEIAQIFSLELDNLPINKSDFTGYFSNYVLSRIDVPLVLAIDEAEILFEYPEIAREFFGLLRCWFDYAQTPGHTRIWEKLRLIIIHSTDDYINLDNNCSPFRNVGFPVRLSSLNVPQVQDLVRCYQLNLNMTEINRLMGMVGGHPFLIQQALFSLLKSDKTFDQLLDEAPTLNGIYQDHLKELSDKVTNAKLSEALMRLIESEGTASLTKEQALRLEGMGLVKFRGNRIFLSCELYGIFFKDWL